MPVEPRAPLALPPSTPIPPPADIAARLTAIGVTVSDETLAKLGDYLGRMLAMNELVNLTAIKDPAEAWERHLLDALSLLPSLAAVPAGGRIADIGSGGGIPGIPLAIARPDLTIKLVESIQKKASFLSGVTEAMGLENVEVRADRAEQLIDLRGTFEVVTARAVARLEALLPLVFPFLRPGGVALLIKGQKADEELVEAKKLLGKMKLAHEQTILTPTGRIVVLRRQG